MTIEPLPPDDGEPFDLDLGQGHYVRWFTRDTAPGVRAGGLWFHPVGPKASDWKRENFGGRCAGAFNLVEGNGPVWIVEKWEPFTLTPSLACSCGAHIFIREGKAVVL